MKMNQKDLSSKIQYTFELEGGIKVLFIIPKNDEYEKNGENDSIRKMLLCLLKARTDDGNYLLLYEYQWYGVYRVLNEKCGFPISRTEFCKRMERMGFGNCRVNCTYKSVLRGFTLCPKLMVKVDMWKDYGDLNENYSMIVRVVEFLLNYLENLGTEIS